MKSLAMLIVVGLLLGPVVKISRAAGGPNPAEGPTEENALEAEKELGQAMRTNDADGFCRLLDSDWAVVTGNGEIGEGDTVGDGQMKAAICAAIKSGDFTRETYDQDLAHARVRVYGNIATVTLSSRSRVHSSISGSPSKRSRLTC